MFDDKQLARETQRTYARVLPRLEQRFAAHLADPVWQVYRQRLDAHFPQLFTRLLALYGDRYDFYYHLETVLDLTARSWLDRPDDLKTLDAARAADPHHLGAEAAAGAGVAVVVAALPVVDALHAAAGVRLAEPGAGAVAAVVAGAALGLVAAGLLVIADLQHDALGRARARGASGSR